MEASAATHAPSRSAFRVFVILVAACGGALLIAVGNVIWFEVLNRFVALEAPIARALLFSSFLIILGAAVVVRDPPAFGFRLGSMRGDLGLILAVVLGYAALTWLALAVAGTTPYDGASKLVEIVLVPVSEELVFRAVMLTTLVAAIGRWAPGRHVQGQAIVIDALAFGLAHGTNALSIDPAFVAMQVVFAAVLGLGCAALMARTRSVYPAMILHAAVNAVVVFA